MTIDLHEKIYDAMLKNGIIASRRLIFSIIIFGAIWFLALDFTSANDTITVLLLDVTIPKTTVIWVGLLVHLVLHLSFLIHFEKYRELTNYLFNEIKHDKSLYKISRHYWDSLSYDSHQLQRIFDCAHPRYLRYNSKKSILVNVTRVFPWAIANLILYMPVLLTLVVFEGSMNSTSDLYYLFLVIVVISLWTNALWKLCPNAWSFGRDVTHKVEDEETE